MLQFNIFLDLLSITDYMSLIKFMFFCTTEILPGESEKEEKLVIATDYEREGLEGGISIICP